MTSPNLPMVRTVALCFLVALMEGLDLQAAGIAAQGMAAAFELDKLHMSWVFSAGIFGLLPGAFVGGWLADRNGRKQVLMASVALFGLFSLLTALAWNFNSLLLARCLTGVGLGAALPNLIALTSEVAGPRLRGVAVSLMYCGVPLGAALAASIGMSQEIADWQLVFWVGGLVPLLIVPLLGLCLPSAQPLHTPRDTACVGVLQGLFHPGTALATVLIWVSYFFTLVVIYILINWLPSLLISQGFSREQAGGVMIALQIGAVAGTLTLGWAMDRLPAWALSALIYLGILASLTALGMASHLEHMLLAGFVAGFFSTGGQCVLYALTPHFYHPSIRTTGVGSAVAIGRLGAMSGPLVAGKMLALGTGTAGVMLASAPGIVIAAVALFYLNTRKTPHAPDLTRDKALAVATRLSP